MAGASSCCPTNWLPVRVVASPKGRAASEASPKQKADEPRGKGWHLGGGGGGMEVASAQGSWRALSLGGMGRARSSGGVLELWEVLEGSLSTERSRDCVPETVVGLVGLLIPDGVLVRGP